MPLPQNPILYLSAKTWQYSKGNRANVVFYIVLCLLANASVLLEPLAIGALLNFIQEHGVHPENFNHLAFYLALIFGTNILFWIFNAPARLIETSNAFRVRQAYKTYLLEGTMALPVSWHTDHHSGDTIDKIEKGTTALYNFATDTFITIGSIMRLVGSFIALVYFNFSSVYLVTMVLFVSIKILVAIDKRLVGHYEELFKIENNVSAKVYDAISNIVTIVILRIEGPILATITEKIQSMYGLFMKSSRLNELKWFLAMTLNYLMICLVLGSYLYQQISIGATIAVGTIVALYGYVQRINDLSSSFAYTYGTIIRQKTAVMNAEEVAQEFKQLSRVTDIPLGTSWRELEIKNLSFSYHTTEGADLHLDNINVTIKRGEKIALIGESGSGKTTLLKLIRGLYQPKQLTLSLDGQLLEQGFEHLSSSIALIPQEPEIFATTVKENITIGLEHSLEEIKIYTDLARFTDVAERLPKKLDSSIVEKGVNLSGGEKQRLALSRGLLACHDKSIILLDEPTSSVDSRNERTIYEGIFKTFTEQAIISSIHRLHLLPLFDRVVLFADGKIIDQGTFAELLKRSGVFQDMWNKYQQAQVLEG